MAQNVTIAGASYSDVPAIDVPKTGGGTARFCDTSGVTVTADKLLVGYTAIDASGNLITGTMEEASHLNVINITGNTTLGSSHKGAHLYCTNSSAITLTLSGDLGDGWNCTVERWGAGTVSISPSSATINGASSAVSLGDQYDAAVSVVRLASAVYSVKGGLADA